MKGLQICLRVPANAHVPRAGSVDPPFRDRVRTRRADGSLDDPRANRGELGVPVRDQELETACLIFGFISARRTGSGS
jgi:hypothetical protein